MRAYEYRHVVGLEETNLVGNVYYVNHLRWQGRCREMFLRDNAPALLEQLEGDFAMATVHCSCDYLDELRAFDEIVVRMRLAAITLHKLSLVFEYHRLSPGGEQVVARGRQEIVCLRRQDGEMVPTPVPDDLRQALRAYGDAGLG